jgi:RHS repeat-associated protein
VLGYTGALEGPDGLIYDQARYYDPAAGEFTTPDTVLPNGEGTQGYGLYDYVADDPVTQTDPGGHLFSLAENSVVSGISNVLS